MDILNSDSEAEDDYGAHVPENLEEVLLGVIQPLSKLKVDEDGQAERELFLPDIFFFSSAFSHHMMISKLNAGEVNTASNPWRSELSKIDIWYATFGSNMWKPRFLCYIEGGQVTKYIPC